MCIPCRHSNGSNEQEEGEDHGDDGGSLSRSASESSLSRAQNGHVVMNNGYRIFTILRVVTGGGFCREFVVSLLWCGFLLVLGRVVVLHQEMSWFIE